MIQSKRIIVLDQKLTFRWSKKITPFHPSESWNQFVSSRKSIKGPDRAQPFKKDQCWTFSHCCNSCVFRPELKQTLASCIAVRVRPSRMWSLCTEHFQSPRVGLMFVFKQEPWTLISGKSTKHKNKRPANVKSPSSLLYWKTAFHSFVLLNNGTMCGPK